MKEEIKYEIVVYWSEDDDAYIAEVPELPGCMADGRTLSTIAERDKRKIFLQWLI